MTRFKEPCVSIVLHTCSWSTVAAVLLPLLRRRLLRLLLLVPAVWAVSLRSFPLQSWWPLWSTFLSWRFPPAFPASSRFVSFSFSSLRDDDHAESSTVPSEEDEEDLRRERAVAGLNSRGQVYFPGVS